MGLIGVRKTIFCPLPVKTLAKVREIPSSHRVRNPLRSHPRSRNLDAKGLMNVRFVTVNSEDVNDLINLQQQSTEASKKAGDSGRSIWQEIKGDHNTFHIVTELENWAQIISVAAR